VRKARSSGGEARRQLEESAELLLSGLVLGWRSRRLFLSSHRCGKYNITLSVVRKMVCRRLRRLDNVVAVLGKVRPGWQLPSGLTWGPLARGSRGLSRPLSSLETLHHNDQ